MSVHGLSFRPLTPESEKHVSNMSNTFHQGHYRYG